MNRTALIYIMSKVKFICLGFLTCDLLGHSSIRYNPIEENNCSTGIC